MIIFSKDDKVVGVDMDGDEFRLLQSMMSRFKPETQLEEDFIKDICTPYMGDGEWEEVDG